MKKALSINNGIMMVSFIVSLTLIFVWYINTVGGGENSELMRNVTLVILILFIISVILQTILFFTYMFKSLKTLK